MDNAKEALQRVKDTQRNIAIRMYRNGDWLVLRFENPYQGELLCRNGSLLSAKGDGKAHGLGLAQAVEKPQSLIKQQPGF